MKKTIKFNGSDMELDFDNGFAMIEIGGKFNYVKPNGELLSPKQWFNFVSGFTEDGVALVSIGPEDNLINKKGELVFKGVAIKHIEMYNDQRYHKVRSELGFTYIKPNGEFAFGDDVWFENGGRFRKDKKYVEVQKDGKWNFIDIDGNLLFKDYHFEYAESFSNGLARVRLYGKENYINENGELLCKNVWFDDVESYFCGVYATVKLYGKKYLIDRAGNLYEGNWCYEETIKRTQWPEEPIWPSRFA